MDTNSTINLPIFNPLLISIGFSGIKCALKLFVIQHWQIQLSQTDRFRRTLMSRVCQVTGKRPMAGNNVSHAKNRTRRRFLPNLHQHRFWVESENRFVRLRVSSKGMRIIDKQGIDAVLKTLRARGEKV